VKVSQCELCGDDLGGAVDAGRDELEFLKSLLPGEGE